MQVRSGLPRGRRGWLEAFLPCLTWIRGYNWRQWLIVRATAAQLVEKTQHVHHLASQCNMHREQRACTHAEPPAAASSNNVRACLHPSEGGTG